MTYTGMLSIIAISLITLSLGALVVGCGELDDEWTSQDQSDHVSDTSLNGESDTHQALDTSSSGRLSCEESPIITWSTFGQGFMTNYCQGCHASATNHRYGAPTGISFDTLDEVIPYRERLLTIITGEEATMPPGGGINDLDVKRLVIWLTCADEMR